jgi:hypothetical protein
MPKQSFVAQDDFSALGLAAVPDADSPQLNDYHAFTTIDRPASADSLRSESACDSADMYCPVNFIPGEVYDMIRTWETSYLKQQETYHAVNSMDTESIAYPQCSGIDLETMRCIPEFAPPPKRFFRTFWRSVARRMVQREKQSAIDRAAMSCSDAYDAPEEI